MTDEAPQIDRNVLEELRQLETKRSEVQGWLDKANELKDRTSQDIYERVCSDYRKRLADLEEQSLPLEQTLQEQYRSLLAHREVLQAQLADVQAQSDELEFRKQIGELEGDDERSSAEKVEAALQKQQSDVEAIDAVIREVLEVVPEEKLRAAAPAPEAEQEPIGEPEPTPQQEPEPAVNKTIIFGASEAAAPSSPPQPDQTSATPSQAGGQTMVVPPAELVEDKTGKPHRLGTVNLIGRGDQNQLRLDGTGVSRKHASITYQPPSFVIKDEGSHFGTFVNDERVTEQALADGDRVQIGEVRLVFHLR